MTVLGIDHVQVAAPPGCEAEARAFYGGLLGLEELPKPEPLGRAAAAGSGRARQELHVGVEEPFAPARKAHPGLVVDDLDGARGAPARRRRHELERRHAIPGAARGHVADPFGNRLELREAGQFGDGRLPPDGARPTRSPNCGDSGSAVRGSGRRRRGSVSGGWGAGV